MGWKFSKISRPGNVSYLVPVLAPVARQYAHAQIAGATSYDVGEGKFGVGFEETPEAEAPIQLFWPGHAT